VTPTKKAFLKASEWSGGGERVEGSLSSDVLATDWITNPFVCMRMKDCLSHGYKNVMKREQKWEEALLSHCLFVTLPLFPHSIYNSALLKRLLPLAPL